MPKDTNYVKSTTIQKQTTKNLGIMQNNEVSKGYTKIPKGKKVLNI